MSATFPLFSHLPPELRVQIYHHICHPRVVTLSYTKPPPPSHGDYNSIDYSGDNGTFHSPTLPPVLLHISREARAEGLRLYTKCFTATPRSPGSDGEERRGTASEPVEEERYIYFHPSLDTLYVPRPGLTTDRKRGLFNDGYAAWASKFAVRMPGVVEVVRKLAVDYVPADVRRSWEAYWKVCLIRGFPKLEEGFLVIGGSCDGRMAGEDEAEEGREVELVEPRGRDGETVGIMHGLFESFLFEIYNNLGSLMDSEVLDVGKGLEMELVPKAKVTSTWDYRPHVWAS